MCADFAGRAAGEEFIPEEWPICCLGQARVTVDGLRCREDPDLSGRVLATFRAGQELDVWAKLRTGWWLVQVRESGLTGWSSGKYLRMAT